MPVGSLAVPLDDRQLWDKFDQCAVGHLPGGTVKALHDELARMAELPTIAPVMNLLAQPIEQAA